jgi:beta-glucosidase
VDWDAATVSYGRWWGQRKLDRDGVAAAYPFGFGLGYTTFTMADLEVEPLDGDRFRVAVNVANTGARPGRHVIQIYAVQSADTGRDVHHLVGFQTVSLDAGTTARVVVDCSVRPIQRWTVDGFTLAARAVTIRAGGYAGDPAAVEATLAVPS